MTPIEFGNCAMTVCAVAALLFLAFPAGRAAWKRYVLLARYLYVEWPLRQITGRRRVDYARLARMEQEERELRR
jgi:hypothetical protein